MASPTYPLGIIGLGKMARCLVRGLLDTKTFKPSEIAFTTRHSESGADSEKELKITRLKDNASLIKSSQIVLLSVKPQNVDEILEQTSDAFSKGQLLISIVASLTTHELEEKLKTKISVIRSMPNTPSLVREGMTALSKGRYALPKDLESAKKIFEAVGRVVQIEETHMNAVTGLSGCGPAFVFVILESLTEGGIKVGLPRDIATQLSAQTVLGAAKMLLETKRHPAALKDDVTTPAGCTIDGLLELEEGKLRVTLIKAVVQSTQRAQQLKK